MEINKMPLDLIRDGYDQNKAEPVKKQEYPVDTRSDNDLPVLLLLSRGFAELKEKQKRNGE
ncbi:hypothetical protein N6H14_31100 [Paenibacillus sp. CC-CFT747]|nr:hypothetical protein N6H14_31100 [Paenibacillus sp. CC-CFT747]